MQFFVTIQICLLAIFLGIFTVFGAKNKGIDDTENPYDNIATEGNHYDVPPSSKGAAAPPPLPKRSTRREGGNNNTIFP